MRTLNQKIEFLNWNNRFNSILTNNLSEKEIDIICLSEKGKKLFNILCNDLKKLNDFSPNITRTFFKTHTARNIQKYYYSSDSIKNINQKINSKIGFCNPKFYFQSEYLDKYVIIERRPDGWGYILSQPANFHFCVNNEAKFSSKIKGFKTEVIRDIEAFNDPKLLKK